ncbi:TcdA/TcdB pore-forming domain-containing protein [Chitinimonas sp. PSY-7]|uniref:TcdA/TcdB pore-forming domain-containing protein n=1 Tax=Chitinimonas sp. PSY-7 TaxID=3459088 RepID=UPI0040403B39
MATYSEALSSVKELMDNDRTVQSYVSNPSENCEAASEYISNLLRQHGIAYEVRAIQLWESAGDPLLNNHYVVIAKIGQHRIALDVTAGQFARPPEAASPIIASERIWADKLTSLGALADQAIHYRDFASHAEASTALAATASTTLLTDANWRVLRPLPKWAQDIVDYPRWGRAYQQFQQSLSGPRQLRPNASQKAEKERQLESIYQTEVAPFKEVESRIDLNLCPIPKQLVDREGLSERARNIRGDIANYDNLLLELDRYHAVANTLNLEQKIARLSDLAKLIGFEIAENYGNAWFDAGRFMTAFREEVRAYTIGLQRREQAREAFNLRRSWRRPTAIARSARRRNGVAQLSYNEAQAQLTELIGNDATLQQLRANPAGNSAAASERISQLLHGSNIGYEVRGLLLWASASDFLPLKHYVVIAKLGGHDIALDICAGQFAGTSQRAEAIIANEKSWEEQFLALDQLRTRAVNYHDFRSHGVAQASLNSDVSRHGLTDVLWTVLGEPPSWAQDIVNYPSWGRKYLQVQRQLALDQLNMRRPSTGRSPNLPAREDQIELGRLWRAEAAEMKAVEKEIQEGTRSVPRWLFTRQELIAEAGQRVTTVSEDILAFLDNYHSEQASLSPQEKIERLVTLARLLQNYARSGQRGASEYERFAQEARAYAIGLRRRDGALRNDRLSGDVWRAPAQQALTSMALNATESSQVLDYRRQLIVQLDGDDNSFYAAKNLFSKHPRHSEWLQLNDGISGSVLGWNEQTREVQAMAPLQLDQDGNVRIVLVGHGRQENGQTLFGNFSAEQLQAELDELMARLPEGKIRGIHLDLLGCGLMDRQLPLAETLPGKLGAWLLSQGDLMGIGREKLSLSAREYPVRVNALGKKEILSEEFGWIGKEAARLHDVLHKVELRWDAESGQMAKSPLQLEPLLTIGHEIESVVHHSSLSREDRASLVSLHQQVGDQVRQLVLAEEAPSAEHRAAVELHAVKNVRSALMAEQWAATVATVKRQQSLEDDWLATIQTRERANGGTELRFVQRSTGQSRWYQVDEAARINDIGVLVNDLSSGFEWRASEQRLVMRAGLGQAEAAHSMNAAFMLQTLMGVNPRNSGLNISDELSDALKVQIYSQLAQNSVGLANDATHVANTVRSALGTDFNLLARASEILGRAGPIAGAVLDSVNIAAIMVELKQTTDPTARVAVETKLGLAVVSSGVNLAVLGASLAGASSLAMGLSVLATPLVGLSVGIPALVDNYQRLRQGFDLAAEQFEAIAASISHPGFQLHDGVWQLSPGAVVDHINFRTGQLHYGSVEVNATRGGSGHTVTGGWDHFFARPDPDTSRWLDVYTGLGLNRQQTFSASRSRVVLLPSGVSRRLTFDYDQLTGRRRANAPALRRLHEHYASQFIWGMYAFPTDWGIYKLEVELRATPVRVDLDSAESTLILQTLGNADERRQLSYILNGLGGNYSVVLPANPLAISIEASANSQERWLFAMDSVFKQHSIENEHIVLGALKPQIFANLHINANSIVIGGQTLSFQGSHKPATLLLTNRISDNATLCLDVDLARGRYEPTLLLSESPDTDNLRKLQQFFASSDANSLLQNGRIRMVINQQVGEIEIASGLSALLPYRLDAVGADASELVNANQYSQRLIQAISAMPSHTSAHEISLAHRAPQNQPMLTAPQ